VATPEEPDLDAVVGPKDASVRSGREQRNGGSPEQRPARYRFHSASTLASWLSQEPTRAGC